MKTKKEQWRSPSLGRTMKLVEYGESGTPILALPTRGQKCGQWEEYGMADALSYQLQNGFNKLFCIDSLDEEAFLNESIEPFKRLLRLQQFESYVIEEVVPFIEENSTIDFLIIAGVDLGGYHAINLALKHPRKFGKAIGMSGVYDIKSFLNGYYNNDVYYNNPIDYIPNLKKNTLLKQIRDVDFRLVSFNSDPRKDLAIRMGDVLRMKFIEHKLDIWDIDGGDEWSLWQKMVKTHII